MSEDDFFQIEKDGQFVRIKRTDGKIIIPAGQEFVLKEDFLKLKAENQKLKLEILKRDIDKAKSKGRRLGFFDIF